MMCIELRVWDLDVWVAVVELGLVCLSEWVHPLNRSFGVVGLKLFRRMLTVRLSGSSSFSGSRCVLVSLYILFV